VLFNYGDNEFNMLISFFKDKYPEEVEKAEKLNREFKKKKDKNITESVENGLNKPLTTKIKTTKHSNGFEETLVIFFDNGSKIGHAKVCETADDPGTMFLYDVEVKSSLRGRGYGTKIVQFMIDKYNVKHLNVAKDNKIAINLYKKFNFKIVGDVRVDDEIMYRMTR
jgi:ribosomal protein S18 acetylase RimI-like enzyme